MPTPIEYADSPTQDWNVYLGLTPDPRVPRVPIPQVDPWGGLNVAGMELPLDEAMKVTHMAATLRAQQEEARAAAIRYQGTMEFQYLLGKGVDSGEAIRQTAGKMFYGHPAGLASAIHQAQNQVAPSELKATAITGPKGETLGHAVWTGTGFHIMPKDEGQFTPGEAKIINDPATGKRAGVWYPTGIRSGRIQFDEDQSSQGNVRIGGDITVGDSTFRVSGSPKKVRSFMEQVQKETQDTATAKAAEDAKKPSWWQQVKSFLGEQPAQVTPAGLGASPQRTIVQPPTEASSPPMEEPNPYPDTLPAFSVPAPAEPAPMGMGLNVRDGMSVPVPMTNAVPVPPLPAAVAPTPPPVAPTEGVRIDPLMGRMTTELDRFYAMTPAEQRMYALTNKSFGAPKPAVAPATTVVQTNLVRPPETLAPPPPKVLTAEIAREFLKMANGDKDKARKLAKEAGYSF